MEQGLSSEFKETNVKVLENGNYVCDECDGRGILFTTDLAEIIPVPSNEHTVFYMCGKCNGLKEVDWVDMIMGGVGRKDKYMFRNIFAFPEKAREGDRVVFLSNMKGYRLDVENEQFRQWVWETNNALDEKVDFIL